MPLVDVDTVRRTVLAGYAGAGVEDDEARIVTGHQVESNLVGHDSHGVARTARYVTQIRAGEIVPGAPIEVEQDTPSTAVVDGHWGFGYRVTETAVRLGVDKARATGVGALTIRRQSHIGRLGGYADLAAREGMIALLMADSGMGPKTVAPFGGAERRLGTNPLCIAVPRGDGDTAVLDMATSAVAVGKLEIARRRGEPIPLGWVVDVDGRPSTDPRAYYDGGAVLPLGGDQGHKGYGLSFMVETMCGLLTGLGFGVAADGRLNDGVFLLVLDPARFLEPARFRSMVQDFCEFLTATPPSAGSAGVLYPGQLEERTRATRLREGIPLDEVTWAELQELAGGVR